LDSTLRRVVEDRVSERISREMDHLREDMNSIPPDLLDGFFRRSARELACRITLIAADGRVLNDTDLDPSLVPQMENQGQRREVVQAREAGQGESRGFSATGQEDRFFFARRLGDGRILRLSVSVAHVREIERGYLWPARVAILAACLLLFVIGVYASQRFSAPIARLTEAASAIASGQSRDLPRGGGVEVEMLSSSLHRMKD